MDAITYAMSKKYTDNKIAESAGLHREIVNSLPATGDNNTIYMVLDPNASSPDVYDEWLWVNGTYEHIGSTRVDLTDYYNKTQVDTALNGKADTSAIPTALSQLTADATHRLVTDTEKSTWNGKANSATTLAGYGIKNAYTKSDMNSFLTTVDLYGTLSSLANNAISEDVYCTRTIPSGYELIGCVGAYGVANGYALDIAQTDPVSNNRIAVKVRNHTGGNRTNLEIVAVGLFFKKA